MGSKLRGDGVEFPDQSVQTTAAASSISTMETFYASGDFIKPVGVTRLEITLVGGGACGGPLGYSSVASDNINYGESTTITINGIVYEAHGGQNRKDFIDFASHTEQEIYGGQAGYLGEMGGVGNNYWPATGVNEHSTYDRGPVGGSGYGKDGGSLQDFIDNWTLADYNDPNSVLRTVHYEKRHASPYGWSGGSGSSAVKLGADWYLGNAGNGGGSYMADSSGSTPLSTGLGGDSSSQPTTSSTGIQGTAYSGKGYIGGGGGTSINVTNVVHFSAGGGGGAGAGGGGCKSYDEYFQPSYLGGAAGQVVTFQIDLQSGGTVAQRTYAIVIGAGGDGVSSGYRIGGGGGQGIAIIKY